MTSIQFYVIGLTRPWFETTRFGFPDLPEQETGALPTRFGFPDLPEQETGALPIRPPRLVIQKLYQGFRLEEAQLEINTFINRLSQLEYHSLLLSTLYLMHW